MKSIAQASKAEIEHLIYSGACGPMEDNEKQIIMRFTRSCSNLWVGMVGEDVLCFYGLIPPSLISDTAYLWLQTTDKLQEHVFTFVRNSQMVVRDMLEIYPTIVGDCRIQDERAQVWLKWLGAKFVQSNSTHLTFEIRKQDG